MHIDHCPKCGASGYLVRTYRHTRRQTYGPYLLVQHYVSKSKKGSTRVRLCFISLKKLHPQERERIDRLLARERKRAH